MTEKERERDIESSRGGEEGEREKGKGERETSLIK